jgi:hypothetical protein
MIIRQYQINKPMAHAIAYRHNENLTMAQALQLDDWIMDELEPYCSAFYAPRAFFKVDTDLLDSETEEWAICDVTRKLSDCATVYLMSK